MTSVQVDPLRVSLALLGTFGEALDGLVCHDLPFPMRLDLVAVGLFLVLPFSALWCPSLDMLTGCSLLLNLHLLELLALFASFRQGYLDGAPIVLNPHRSC